MRGAALFRLFAASLLRRRLASALSLLAIALGVALGLAVQLIHGAALEEFDRGARLLAGKADVQVSGPRGGFDDALYVTLAQRPEVADASPLLEVEARLPGAEGGDAFAALRIVGVDMFRLVAVGAELLPVADDGDVFAALQPDALFLSAAAREALVAGGGEGGAGTEIAVQSGRAARVLRVAGGVPGAAGQQLGVMDIAAAQRTFDMIGRLTRIDLKLAPGVSPDEALAALRPLLPAGVEARTPAAESAEAGALSRAYRVNLSMLAAIALLTGGFLVFSAQSLSVVRRAREFVFLRALGLDRCVLLRGLLLEGSLLGLLGAALGVALAYGLAALAFRFVGGDLGAGYFAGVRPTLRFAPLATALYAALGVAAGIAGSWLPAREAMRIAPARGLRAGLGERVAPYRHGRRRAVLAVACAVLAGVACLLPPVAGIPLGGYAAVGVLLAAAMLVLPGATRAAVMWLRPRRGVVGRLARARLHAVPGQAVVAGAGVVASVALAAAMAIMVSSFRLSVESWLHTVLPADLYVRASPSPASGFLDDGALRAVRALPGVAAADAVRSTTLRLAGERPPVALIARAVEGGWGLPLVAGSHEPALAGSAGGGAGDMGVGNVPPVWVSEALVDLYGVGVGDELSLPLEGALQRFRITGVWRDYARQHGTVIVDLGVYRRLTGDYRINDIAVRLAPGGDVASVAVAIRAALGERMTEVAPQGEIRRRTLAIFDRTFLVTYLMEAVAVLIGLFGVATTFAALSTARRAEFGMLRHLGASRGEIGRLLALEGGLTASVGVGVGLVAGCAISWVLIEVINRQSFHWSMDLSLPVGALTLFAVTLVALAAWVARLAGARAMRQSAVRAVREDW